MVWPVRASASPPPRRPWRSFPSPLNVALAGGGRTPFRDCSAFTPRSRADGRVYRNPSGGFKRTRRLGTAVERLSRLLQDDSAERGLRHHLGTAARSGGGDASARRLCRRPAAWHRAFSLSPLVLDDRRLLLS